LAYTYQQIVEAEYADLANEEAHAAATLEQARITEDVDAIKIATDRIYTVDQKRQSLTQRVQGFNNQQAAQPQRSRFGLTPEEQEIARLLPDTHKDYRERNGAPQYLSDDQKEEIYARNRAKLRTMRQNGSYRDQTG
jgi:hypothetical protein